MAILNMVRDYERVAKFQLGRYVGMKGPGLVWIIPILQAGVKVDTREQYFDVPPQRNITRDNAGVDVDFVVYLRVMDPERTVLEVRDYLGAARQLATTTLRAVVGEMALDEVLSRRDDINDMMRIKLDEVTNRWGVKVTAVEIREIEPPPAIAEAMTRQMSAERTRRAQITESEGSRDAQINVAEGERQAAILEAEGQRQSQILRASGHKEAQLLEAEGYASALSAINEVAADAHGNTMGLQYLDAIRTLATSESTKWIVPMELTNAARAIVERLGVGSNNAGASGGGSG